VDNAVNSDHSSDHGGQGTVEHLLKPENHNTLVKILTYHVRYPSRCPFLFLGHAYQGEKSKMKSKPESRHAETNSP
jgi:hypothetical protein